MPPIQDVDDDATINDAPSLTEDFGNYDSHDEIDNAFPELDFSERPSGAPVTHQRSNPIISSGSSVNTSTPMDHRTLPEQQQYPLPTYDQVMQMDSNLNTPTTSHSSSSTHYYPDESQVTYRHKNST